MCLATTISFAQFKMEKGVVDVGLRTGSLFSKQVTKPYTGEKFPAAGPLIGIVWDVGVSDWGLSMGGEVNYSTFKKDNNSTASYGYTKATSLQIIVNFKYYPQFIKTGKLAPYIRLDAVPLALYSLKGPNTTLSDNKLKSVFGIYAAANYQLANRIGVFAEIGLGYTKANAGVMWRLQR